MILVKASIYSMKEEKNVVRNMISGIAFFAIMKLGFVTLFCLMHILFNAYFEM